jgi:hypothetical protein
MPGHNRFAWQALLAILTVRTLLTVSIGQLPTVLTQCHSTNDH